LFSPFTRWLAVFAVANCLLISAVLHLTHSGPTTLAYTRNFFRHHVECRDSWDPMRMARERVDALGPKNLYNDIFFKQHLKFQYPPTALLFLEPLWHKGSVSDKKLDRLSWRALVASGVITTVIFLLSLKQYNRGSWPASKNEFAACAALGLCFCCTFYPWTRSFWLGQIQSWIDLFFAAAVLAWMWEKKWVAGALLGLVCAIKPQIGLLLPWALVRKECRFAAGFGAVVLALVGSSVLSYGFEDHVEYLRVLSYIAHHGEAYYANQSVNGLLHRLLLDADALTWDRFSFAPFNPWIYGGTLVTSVGMVGMALFWRPAKHKAAELTDFFIAALSFTMAAPVAWEHHYGIMLPMFAVALPATLAMCGGWRKGGLIALAVSFVLASNLFEWTDHLAASRWNFAQSYLFFAGLIFLAQLYLLRAFQQSTPDGAVQLPCPAAARP